MMVSPEGYIEMLKDKSYMGLMKERDSLLREIRRFEKDKDQSGEEWIVNPSPDVRYQMNLQYIGKICDLMARVYNREYV